MSRLLIFVADHKPDGRETYRFVRHRGLEARLASMDPRMARAVCDEIGPRENIPAGAGRRAALRRALGKTVSVDGSRKRRSP